MLKTIIIPAIFAATAMQASAESGKTYDLSVLPPDVAARVFQLQQHGDRFERVIEATLAEWSKPSHSGAENGYDLSILPPDVAAEVVKLQQHGDRFEAAIRAIFIEAMKPSSGFDCLDEPDASDIPQT